MNIISRLFNKTPSLGKVAINVRAKDSSWGGGNQFIQQFAAHLRSTGFRVTHRLERDVTHILIIEPRQLETTAFGIHEIAEFKAAHPSVRIFHRINECDKRKGTSDMDELLRQANQLADGTIFISEWLRDYFLETWFNGQKPHWVIQNGADPRIFKPASDTISPLSGPFRLVTHHWSDNWMKGFRVYEKIDSMIAAGELKDVALTVIGRWPKEIRWKAAETHGAVHGTKLADLLQRNHAYVTASMWEPCGMHHIEGAQCGLPLVYHEDGGGIVEFGRRYGIGFRDNVAEALLEARDKYPLLRKQVLENAPSGKRMCEDYAKIMLSPLPEAR